jgi:hypothetical protein
MIIVDISRKAFAHALTLCVLAFFAGNAMAETALEVSVEPGKNWKTLSFIGVFPVRHAPQIAVWIEDGDGNFVKTVSATKSAATGTWRAAPETGRPDSLPVWLHASRRGAACVGQTPGATGTDAVSSATPDAGLSASAGTGELANGATYAIRLEVNTSFDYNDAWPKKAKAGTVGYSGVNGQPSVVYEGRFVAGVPATVELVPVGTGSIDGSDGAMKSGVGGLTTALELIRKATVTVR